MTKAEQLRSLADRCEAASGPDRVLDVEIIVAVDWKWGDWEEGDLTAKAMADKHGVEWLSSRTMGGNNSIWRHLPRMTASLDAAMMLVPEGWHVGYLTQCHEDNETRCCLTENAEPCRDAVGQGVDMIMSLLAAALRALAEKEEG